MSRLIRLGIICTRCCLALLALCFSLRAEPPEPSVPLKIENGNAASLGATARDLVTVKIQVDAKVVARWISPDFAGFGYETSIMAVPGYFSARNSTLIQLYRNVSANGLIRIGGNVSDHTKYMPDGAPVVSPDSGVTIINRASLVDLAEFARATGWKVMWGLNLGTGSKEEAVEEAKAVDAALGDSFQSFEIGNEVDLKGGYTNTFKDYESYYTLFLTYKAAIRAALPHARFSGPDVAGNMAWLGAFAETESKDAKLLTYHHYRTGASKPEATIETLLNPYDAWEVKLKQLQRICQERNASFRINEINSFYGGGKPGVSDTFASALWCLDNMFLMASHGCGGVNMQTDINQHTWISHYSPIVHDAAMHCEVRPEYYGMLAFAMAGKGDPVQITLKKGEINLTAYATRDGEGKLTIIVVNKDLTQDAQVETALPVGFAGAEAFRLSAPSVDSKDHVTFAGAEVSSDGKWTPEPPEQVAVNNGEAYVKLPHASALVLRFTR